jgi:hypothetical protein
MGLGGEKGENPGDELLFIHDTGGHIPVGNVFSRTPREWKDE